MRSKEKTYQGGSRRDVSQAPSFVVVLASLLVVVDIVVGHMGLRSLS